MVHGSLALLLHAHLPFVRHPEHEQFLEEDWFFEAVSDTYLPLLDVFERLDREGVPFRLSMSFSATLLSMLRDGLLRERAERYLKKRAELVENELVRTRGDGSLQYLAQHYRGRVEAALRVWRRWDGDLVAAFGALEERGRLELLTCAATHAYLPLWRHHPETLRAQIRVGQDEHARHFGRAPRGIWLPECGFFPGLDRILGEAGLRYFVIDAHGILFATPRPRHGVYAPIFCTDSGVAAFGRDPESSTQVWSRETGYPGDPSYREFYRDIGWDLPLDYIGPFVQPTGARKNTGVKYHRITGPGSEKELYDPHLARERAAAHAADFVHSRERQVLHLLGVLGREPLVVAPYDAELFGHWWYEGPWWLDYVIRKVVHDSTALDLTHPGEYLTRFPTQQVATPAESSWGEKGYHEVWLSDANAWIYPHAHRAAERMAELARLHADAPMPPAVDRALSQAARETLLAQASDWAFILRAGTMKEYASTRVVSHLRRFLYLERQLADAKIDEDWLTRVEALDNLFPNLQWRRFL